MFSGNSSLVANLFSLKVAKSVFRGRRYHYNYTEEFAAHAGAGRVRSIMRAATVARLAAMSDGGGGGTAQLTGGRQRENTFSLSVSELTSRFQPRSSAHLDKRT